MLFPCVALSVEFSASSQQKGRVSLRTAVSDVYRPRCCYCSATQLCQTLWLHALPHTRLPCPSLSPRVCPNSCPLSRWCHPTISSSLAPFSSCPLSFPASGSFPMSWALRIRWPKYWSFSISFSNEHSGLIFFRIDWLELLAVQGTLKSLLQHHDLQARLGNSTWHLLQPFACTSIKWLYLNVKKTRSAV